MVKLIILWTNNSLYSLHYSPNSTTSLGTFSFSQNLSNFSFILFTIKIGSVNMYQKQLFYVSKTTILCIKKTLFWLFLHTLHVSSTSTESFSHFKIVSALVATKPVPCVASFVNIPCLLSSSSTTYNLHLTPTTFSASVTRSSQAAHAKSDLTSL